ncbi:MAG: ribonuclease H-like domain-containing protein [Saprospiraceae bacterium]|nr:ribonuclease H-like domain-containing protein [Saprospiraceae bacterium]
MTLYLDAEWTLDQNIFLLGYAFADGRSGALYESRLNQKAFIALLKGVKYIIIYGPDIAYLEKHFGMELRNDYICINALKLFRQVLPGLSSYKLAYIEQLYAVGRQKRKYKTSVFTIWKDWFNLEKRKHVIIYNQEDVVNLRKLFQIICRRFDLTDEQILTCRLV